MLVNRTNNELAAFSPIRWGVIQHPFYDFLQIELSIFAIVQSKYIFNLVFEATLI